MENMKKFQNKILSVLLVAFSILIVHDYIIVDLNNKCELSCYKLQKNALEDTSKIHLQIHLAMDVPRPELSLFELICTNENILDTQAFATSYINPVLLRPPTTT